jgi:hypothetical protein
VTTSTGATDIAVRSAAELVDRARRLPEISRTEGRVDSVATSPVSSVGHDAAVTDLADPGWKPALPAVIPLFGRVVASRGGPQIVVMRALWLSFASAMVWIGVVVLLLTSTKDASGSPSPGYAAIAGAAVVTLLGTIWARRRRSRVDPDANDANAYRTYFFIAIAFGELPALVGFVFALLQSRAPTYLVGAVITLVAFVFVAPTRRFLARQGPLLRGAMLR